MKVHIRHPQPRTVEFSGNHPVFWVLKQLEINPETVLVIRGNDLLTSDAMVYDQDEIEVRSAISGGA
ncbi:MAG TPA: thiamine biosynthesis protein ThiS [Dehalococcoidia bacterium]